MTHKSQFCSCNILSSSWSYSFNVINRSNVIVCRRFYALVYIQCHNKNMSSLEPLRHWTILKARPWILPFHEHKRLNMIVVTENAYTRLPEPLGMKNHFSFFHICICGFRPRHNRVLLTVCRDYMNELRILSSIWGQS
jgi:hypothetical protein